MLFDSWAGVLAPSLFRACVIAPTARIVAALRARHPAVPVIGFPRQAGSMLAEFVRVSGVQGIGLDTSADLTVAARDLPAGVAIQGNLDPLALAAGGPAMARETDAILAAMRGRPFIFNLGHGIVPQTPPAHVAALVARIRAA
jgi:uroporphyrinogen decarboxylase